MFPSGDMEDQLRRRQILQQLNQVMGPESAMLGGGANLQQFGGGGGGDTSQDAQYQPQQSSGARSALMRALMPDAAQRAINTPGKVMSSGIAGLMSGKGFSGFNPNAVDHTPTLPTANPPTLYNKTPPGQPTLAPGQVMSIGPDGKPIAIPNPNLPVVK